MTTSPPQLRSRFRHAAAFLLGASLSVQPSIAAPRVQTLPPLQVSERLPIPPGYLSRNSEDYYGIYDKTPNSKKNGAKIGWMKASQHPETWNGERWAGSPVIVFENVSNFVFQLEGKRIENLTAERMVYSGKEPYFLLKATYEEQLRGFSRRITLRRTTNGLYDAEIMEADTTRKHQLAGLDLSLLDLASPETWALSAGRQRGDHYASQSFDIKELAPYVDRYEFLESKQETVKGTAIPVWTVECEDTKANYKTIFRYTTGGKMLSALVAGTTELRREPRESATRIDFARDIFADSLVPIVAGPLPGDSNKLVRRLEVTLQGSDVTGIQNTKNQVVSYTGNPKQVRIVVQPEQGKAQHVPDEALAAFLEETPDLPIHDQAIQRLAREAAGKAKGVRSKVINILDFVRNYIHDDYGAEPLSLLDILKQKRGDCTEHAMLFTALCRANGIPCREATGYLYMGDAKRAFGGHAWNEVVIDSQWIPVDPTWGQFPLDAAHIQLSSGKSTMRDSKFLSGGIEVVVEKVQVAAKSKP